MDLKLMTLDELHEKHNKLAEGEILLDVRGPDEFACGTIEGSLNIPHEQVLDHVEELKKYKAVYIYCKRGGRAQMAYQILRDEGLDNLVCIAEAGMDEWMSRGYPVK